MRETISVIAAQAGVSADTLRYYERLGLLGPAPRAANGYRCFEPGVVERVRLIKGAQRTGLLLHEIKELLEVRDRGACPCGHTRILVQRRLREVDDELDRLQLLRGELADILAGLDSCSEPRTGPWWCEAEFMVKGGEHR